MAALPLIHDSDVSGWRSWFARHDIAYRPKAGDIRFEDYDLALEAAKRGLGALLLRTRKDDIPEPLRRLHADQFDNPLKCSVLIASNEERPAVRRFAVTFRALMET